VSFHLKASKAMRVMRASRAYPGAGQQWRGDPGLFSSIGKVLGSVVSAVVPGGGAIVEGINAFAGLTRKKKSGNLTQAGVAVMPAPSVGLAAGGFMGGGLLGSLMGPGQGANRLPTLPGHTTPSDGGIPGPVEWMRNQGVRGLAPEATGGCPRGYHPNKTGYYTSQGFVAPGSACVKNRKRNPLNPRAASRAMARLEGARKATRAISKFFGGTKRAGPPRGGCGCRGKRR
jgi:hypothetical protein